MKKARFLLFNIFISFILFCGCSGKKPAQYEDPQSNRTVVNIDKINIQDWANAANRLVDSLLNSGALERAPEQPAIMAISRITNNTREHIDTDLLTKKIRTSLMQSGKVLTTTTIGLGPQAEDPLARQLGDKARSKGVAPPEAIPYFTLSGKVAEDTATAQRGKFKQQTYIFQMTLTEVNTGLAVWEDEELIMKQGNASSIGW